MFVLGDVLGIVKVYKIILLYLPINGQCRNNEKQADQYIIFNEYIFSLIICFIHGINVKLKDVFQGLYWLS